MEIRKGREKMEILNIMASRRCRIVLVRFWSGWSTYEEAKTVNTTLFGGYKTAKSFAF